MYVCMYVCMTYIYIHIYPITLHIFIHIHIWDIGVTECKMSGCKAPRNAPPK